MKYCLLALLMVQPLFAQKNASIPDPDPELERKTFIVAPGFEVSLWAADPLLAKPIQMNWDAQGRLWIASSEVYPQIKPGQVANDKILILEDTTGKGVADKTTVFADGLLIPTAVLPGDGGAYVANSTEIVHLSASKPGQKADKRRVVLSGFGTEDTHHLVHTLRWGPDGAMYFNQSVYIHSHVETPHGTVRLNGGGIWRYEPKSQKLEVFARGFWNPWGLQFDKYGQAFATDGANGEGIVHVIPGASYPTGGNQAPRVLHGLNPGSPKFCGLEIVSGRHFPDDWQGDLITNDFRGHRVCRFKLRDDGSTFESREMEEVIRSNHPAFRPIDVSIGPDGALYIADWYNPIIQHGEVDFRDERRDKTHGRIWRVTAKGRPLVEKADIARASTKNRLEMLKAPEMWTRRMAGKALGDQGCDANDSNQSYADLIAWAGQQSDDHHLTEARWVFRGWGLQHDEKVFDRLVNAEDAGLRAAFARLMAPMGFNGDHTNPVGGVNALLYKLLNDPSPQVRLAAVRTAATYEQYTTGPLKMALSVIDHPMDPTLDYALQQTVRDQKQQWLPAFVEGKLDYGNDMKKLAFALEAVQSPETIEPLVQLLKSGKIPNENLAAAWTLVARLGGAVQLGEALRFALASKDGEARLAVYSALEQSAKSRSVSPTAKDLEKLIGENLRDDSHRERLVLWRLYGLWKLQLQSRNLRTFAVSPPRKSADSRSDAEMAEAFAEVRAALDGLAAMKEPDLIDYLTWRCGKIELPAGVPVPEAIAIDRESSRYALLTLIRVDAGKAAPLAAKSLAGGDDPANIVAAFLQLKNGAAMLAKALEKTTLSADTAKIALKAVKNAGNPSPALIAAITKAGNLTAVQKEPTPDEIKSLTADALAKGDAARGEAIFRRKDLQCFNCHAIGGAGGAVGPDLTSIGASAQMDYLVESLLLPNKAIKEGYHTVDVTTLAGRIVSGVKVREAGGELVLRDKDDKEIAIKLDDIDTRRVGRSLMPDGTTESLTRGELQDLAKFLSELGKQGPYAPVTAKVVRKWEVIEPTPENLNLFRRERIGAAAEKPGAFAAGLRYANVNGSLPLADVPGFTVWKESGQQSVVRFKLMVSSAGEANLKFNNTAGIAMYVAAVPVVVDRPLALKTGEATVTLVLDRAKAASDLRVELAEGGTARVAIVNGR